MAATASMKQKLQHGGGRCTADPRSGACGACRDHPGKGTDRSKYFRGQVDKYRWQEFGSSYLPSELNVAYLYAQLEMADQINEARLARWNEYYKLLTPLAQAGKIELPVVPEGCVHNAHMFYIKTADEHERQELINYLKERDILAVYHYVPLHSALQESNMDASTERMSTRQRKVSACCACRCTMV